MPSLIFAIFQFSKLELSYHFEMLERCSKGSKVSVWKHVHEAEFTMTVIYSTRKCEI